MYGELCWLAACYACRQRKNCRRFRRMCAWVCANMRKLYREFVSVYLEHNFYALIVAIFSDEMRHVCCMSCVISATSTLDSAPLRCINIVWLILRLSFFRIDSIFQHFYVPLTQSTPAYSSCLILCRICEKYSTQKSCDKIEFSQLPPESQLSTLPHK